MRTLVWSILVWKFVHVEVYSFIFASLFFREVNFMKIFRENNWTKSCLSIYFLNSNCDSAVYVDVLLLIQVFVYILGGRCLAVTLQNERGGRQKCYSHDSSALVDGITPTASTGSFYLEKICVRKFSLLYF